MGESPTTDPPDGFAIRPKANAVVIPHINLLVYAYDTVVRSMTRSFIPDDAGVARISSSAHDESASALKRRAALEQLGVDRKQSTVWSKSMKLGVMAAGLGSMGWEKALDYCKQVGLDAIELPVGAYPGKPFFEPEAVLDSASEQTRIKDDVARRGLRIIGLAVHGNPVSPDPAMRAEHTRAHDTAVRLAPRLGTDVVINFSGCPGGSPTDTSPNWITCAWPPEFGRMLEHQWNDVLLPFWSKRALDAQNEGVKIAFEAHPGFCVYNTETLLKLRAIGRPVGPKTCAGNPAVPSNLGANLDPSHFFWQGIDPVESARVLGDAGAIFHVHGKDCGIDPHNMRLNGGLDTKNYGDLHNRSWVFRACGYGHGDEFWKPFISMLRVKGYDGVISIEHEDSLMSVQEGFEKAVAYLRGVMIRHEPGGAWWF